MVWVIRVPFRIAKVSHKFRGRVAHHVRHGCGRRRLGGFLRAVVGRIRARRLRREREVADEVCQVDAALRHADGLARCEGRHRLRLER